MGKIRKGVLGGFSGKVGTVIGSSWNGISYMRSLPQHFNDARTPRQLQQRAKFNKAMEFLTPIKDYIRIGYKIYAVKKSAFNAAVSYMVKNAVGGSYPDIEINYQRMLVSRGDLTPPKDVAATISERCVTITWNDNSAEGSADASDLSMPLAYNVSKDQAVFEIAASTRSSQSVALPLPSNWLGDTIQLYLGFISEDGMEVANSVYLGSEIVIYQ